MNNHDITATTFVKLLIDYKKHRSIDELFNYLDQLSEKDPTALASFISIVNRQQEGGILEKETCDAVKKHIETLQKEYSNILQEDNTPWSRDDVTKVQHKPQQKSGLNEEIQNSDATKLGDTLLFQIEHSISGDETETGDSDTEQWLKQKFDPKSLDDIATKISRTEKSNSNVVKKPINDDDDEKTLASKPPTTEAEITTFASDRGKTELSSEISHSDVDIDFTFNEHSEDNDDKGENINPGSIIKDRFLLQRQLGIGGMGTVYLALDLIKEEAKDKNPHVAIKVLNDDFKQHKDSFIALQRESSRQQKLAHPNITTVYDFDRVHREGKQVFIVMEYLDGEPLNQYLKKTVRPAGGLSIKDALPIIRQLCLGLGYAHKRKLVHSDFKPGNAFLCRDGTVKILDFGIARATKNPLTGDLEKTLFDAGELGALTPAYASLEMLDGKLPDQRDDIYALGCVCYELLTGKHPFQKTPATKAKERNMTVAPVKGLSKKQNEALRDALAFTREARSPSIKQFLEKLEDEQVWYKNPYIVTAAISAVALVGMISPTIDYFQNKASKKLSEEIASGSRTRIMDSLSHLQEIDAQRRFNIVNGDAKQALQTYFAQELSVLSDVENGTFNFIKAANTIKLLESFYPDTGYLQEQLGFISVAKNKATSELQMQLYDLVDTLGPDAIEKTHTLLERIKTNLDPESPLLSEPRVIRFYLDAAESVAHNNIDEAVAIITQASTLIPNSPRLQFAKKKYTDRSQKLVLEDKIIKIAPSLEQFHTYKEHEDTIISWAHLVEDKIADPRFIEISRDFAELFSFLLDQYIEQRDKPAISQFTDEYQKLLEIFNLNELLTKARLALLTGEERTNETKRLANSNVEALNKLIQEKDIQSNTWQTDAESLLRQMDILVQEDASLQEDFERIKDKVADAYIASAHDELAKENFDEALNIIGRGYICVSENEQLANTEKIIIESKKIKANEDQVAVLKRTVKTHAESGQVEKAENALNDLRTLLSAQDPFITIEAPKIIAAGYLLSAKQRQEEGKTEQVFQHLERGMLLDPLNKEIENFRNSLIFKIRLASIKNTLSTKNNFDVAEMNKQIAQLQSAAPGRYADVRNELIEQLVNRIEQLKTQDKTTASILASLSAELFPIVPALDRLRDELKIEPWPFKITAEATLATGQIAEAEKIVQSSQEKYQQHPEFKAFVQAVQARQKKASEAYEIYLAAKKVASNDFTKLVNTQNLLANVLSLWNDNPEYIQESKEIAKLVESQRPVTRIARENLDQNSKITVQKAWSPISSKRECSERLAGYGKRTKALCFDMIHAKLRGPLMVVVPKNETQKSFAIGKTELSVKDYNKYCLLSEACTVNKDPTVQENPISNISLEAMEAYTEWLSERTGKKYRIPTPKEWLYAAQSDEKSSIKNYNCRVVVGGNLIKGGAPVEVNTGASNQWGLKNYIGNVKELVKTGDKIFLLGGDYQTAFSKCDISLSEIGNGSSDKTTGLRILLEL